MNLKEAFRYQNRLQAFLDTANSVLADADNITKVTKTHLRHEVMPEVEEFIIKKSPRKGEKRFSCDGIRSCSRSAWKHVKRRFILLPAKQINERAASLFAAKLHATISV